MMATDSPSVLDLRGVEPGPDALAPAVEHLRQGGILGYPTETVYGFGGVLTEEAVARVTALKRRDPAKPLLVLVTSAEHVEGLTWSDAARALADVFWPGAVTLVLPDPTGIFPPGVRSAAGSVAVRVSPHPVVRALLAGLDGSPLTSTSANVPGEAPVRAGHEAVAVAEALGARGDVLVLDAGTLPVSGPSTLVDCTGPEPVVLRQGTVPLGRLRCVLPEIHGFETR